MLFSNHDQSKAIATLLCPLMRNRSPKVSFRWLAASDDHLFHSAVQTLQMLGVRKRFFQSKRNYVIESLLFFEVCFETAHPIIELHTTAPRKGAWTGSGQFKEVSARDGMMLSKSLYDALGVPQSGPTALIEIDVSEIWLQIAPLLESLDATERAAQRERERIAGIERITKSDGPPATPEQAAELKRILSNLGIGEKSSPDDRNA